MIIIGIIIAIIIFSLVILIHEFGHFYTARKFGVKVEEFGLGIPPKAKVFFTDKLGTKYTLNWLPLGGFVRLNGENGEEKNIEDKTKFYNKSYLQKSIILLAGVFMNFLLASIIFSILFIIGIKPLGINDKIPTNLNSKIIPTYNQAINEGILLKNEGLILTPVVGSISEKSGIKQGDILTKINNKKINSYSELKEILIKNKNKVLILEIERIINNSKKEIRKINIKTDENGKIGTYIGENISINENFEHKYNILNSIKYGFKETYIQSILTIKGLGIIGKKIFNPKNIEERNEALEQMTGPIGIVDFVSNNFGAGIIFLSIITAIISINLGILNLLPIPALDGGRFFLLTINTFLSKISKNKINFILFENSLHLIFFVILIALSLLIGYNDIDKIINR